MKENFILNKYVDPYSILVINSKKKLFRVFCPFKVRCCVNLQSFGKGTELVVDMIKTTNDNKIVYCIGGKDYYHSFFSISDKV